MVYDLVYAPEKLEFKKKEHSILDFKIDTSYYEYKGSRIVRIIDID